MSPCLEGSRDGLDVGFATVDTAGAARLAETQKDVVTPEGTYERQYRVKKKG